MLPTTINSIKFGTIEEDGTIALVCRSILLCLFQPIKEIVTIFLNEHRKTDKRTEN